MRSVVKLFILILFFVCREVYSQSDTIPYRVLVAGKTQGENKTLVITSDKEYFDYYYNIYGVFPQNFKWDFEKEFIIVIYKTLSSGSHSLFIKSVHETNEDIIIKTGVIKSEFSTADMSPQFIMLAIKKTDKPIITD